MTPTLRPVGHELPEKLDLHQHLKPEASATRPTEAARSTPSPAGLIRVHLSMDKSSGERGRDLSLKDITCKTQTHCKMDPQQGASWALGDPATASSITQSILRSVTSSFGAVQNAPSEGSSKMPAPCKSGGIGLLLERRDDRVMVKDIASGGVSEKCGLIQPGDVLESVNDEEVSAMALEQIHSIIRQYSMRSTAIRLQLARHGTLHDCPLRFVANVTNSTLSVSSSKLSPSQSSTLSTSLMSSGTRRPEGVLRGQPPYSTSPSDERKKGSPEASAPSQPPVLTPRTPQQTQRSSSSLAVTACQERVAVRPLLLCSMQRLFERIHRKTPVTECKLGRYGKSCWTEEGQATASCTSKRHPGWEATRKRGETSRYSVTLMEVWACRLW